MLLAYSIVNGQNNSGQSIDENLWRFGVNDRSNFFEMRSSFDFFMESYVDSQAPESVKKEVKYFQRFIAFWEGRTETEDLNTTGDFETYSLNLLDWSDIAACESDDNPIPWLEIGPYNLDKHKLGRVDCVWMNPVNPDVVLAGTPNSGIFRTTNGTAGDDVVWENVTDTLRLPGLGCATIAVDPSNNDIIYAGTGTSAWWANGFYGPGIIKSTDGGDTWIVLDSFVANFSDVKTRVHMIKIKPGNSSVIYATARNGVYKSLNSGATWNEITPPGMVDNEQFFISLEFDFNDPSIFYIGSINPNSQGGGATMWRTENEGSNWTQIQLEDDVENSPFPPDNIIVDFYSAASPWTATGNEYSVEPVGTSPFVLEAELVAVAAPFVQSVLADGAEFFFTVEGVIPVGCRLDIVTVDIDGNELQTFYSTNGFVNVELIIDINEWQLIEGFPDEIHFIVTKNSNYLAGTSVVLENPFLHPLPAEFEINSPKGNVVYASYSGSSSSHVLFFKSENRGDDWEYITETSSSGFFYVKAGLGRFGFEVTDDNTNHFYSAGNIVGEYDGTSWNNMHPYSANENTHADVRYLTMYKYNNQDILLAGNDGGVSIAYDGTWQSLNGEKFGANLIYDVGTSELETDRYVLGLQDNGTMFYEEGDWTNIGGGDGGGSAIDPYDPNIVFHSAGGGELRKRYNTVTGNMTNLGVGVNIGRSYKMPITPDPYNEGVLFIGSNSGLVKKTYNDFVNSSSGPSSLVGSSADLNSRGRVYDIDFCNDEVMYYTTLAGLWGDGTNIYRSDDSGDSWSDISANNLASQYFGPSSVLAEPNNPSRVWTSHMGLPNGIGHLRVMMSADAGDTWVSWSKGLPAVPANDLAYQEGANNLYLGTDVGVYYRHRDDPVNGIGWQCFNSGLPVCLVNDVDVINCSQELVISTYGRGVWTTDLLPNVSGDLIINTDQTWSGQVNQYSNIIIEDGVMLTITGTLSMAEGKTITVEKGGRLTVNGGTITNGCGKLWGGIYAEGGTNGQAGSDPSGKVSVINNSEISYARSALNNFIQNDDGGISWSSTGGRLYSQDSKFLNNKRDTQFIKYQNENSAGNPIADYSRFDRCDFIVNDEYVSEEGVIPSATIYRCEGIRFRACDFVDNRSDMLPTARRIGVLVSKGSARIDKNFTCNTCPVVPSTFTNMYKGVEVLGSGSALFNTHVKNSKFKNCWRGVYLWSNANTEIVLNDFEVTPYPNTAVNDFPVGVYLHSKVSDYIVEENNFYPIVNSTGPMQGNSIGVVANTGVENNEEIYRNDFKHLSVGFESIGKNKLTDNYTYSGIRIKCNNFTDDRRDMYLVKGNDVYNQYGIANNQGTASTDELAFNTFAVNDTYINIDNELNQFTDLGAFTYVYSQNVIEEEPTVNYYVFPSILTNVFLIYSDQGDILKCPSNFGVIDIVLGKDKKESAIASGIQKENEMAQVLDGGDTEGLQTDVSLTTDTEAWKRYMELMSKSGYITEPVLEELTANENGFTKAMTRNVLVANPHSAKSLKVTEALDLRSDPLPEYMREQIKMGLTQISTKEFLTMQRDRYKLNQDNVVQRMYHTLLKDSIPTDSMQTFIDILSGNDDMRYDYKLVELYDAVGQDYLGDALLNAMENYDVPLVKLDELGRYKSFRALMKQWAIDGENEMALDEADLQVLEGYAEFNDKASAQAITILRMNDAIAIEEPVFINEDDKKLESMKPRKEQSQLGNLGNGELSLYPNPADDYFTVQYRIDEVFQEARLRVIDVKGVVVHDQKLPFEEDQIIIKRSVALTSGIYQCELSLEGKIYLVQSIVLR